MGYDLIVIGGGPAGLSAVRAARWAKASVVLINDGPAGGDCTFTGCIPSKTLLAAGRQGASFDEAMARVTATVDRIADTESPEALARDGIDFIDGRARLVGPNAVEVDGRSLTGTKIVVATGTAPAVPPITGLAESKPLTTENLFSLASQPSRLAIIGGGAIGCEMAQAFSQLGTSVTLIEAASGLLAKEEPEASEVIETAMRDRGVSIHTGAKVHAVRRVEGTVLIETSSGEIESDEVLVAVGRTPITAGLGLEAVGVDLDERGFITTDDRLATSVPTIYAAGDITGKLAFTGAADEMGRLAVGNALKTGIRGRYRTDHTPWVTFTAPEVARIGLSEAEAAARRGTRVVFLPMSEMDRAITDGAEYGFIKVVTGPRRLTRHLGGGVVLGATIVAPRAGEMINEIALAMRTRAFAGRLAQTVHAYPSWGYGIQKAMGQLFGEVEGRRWRPARR